MALISQPPQQGGVQGDDGQIVLGWANYFSAVFQLLTAMTQSGTTAKRPTTFLWAGRNYFDTTLGLPIFYKGPGWVKADGTPA